MVVQHPLDRRRIQALHLPDVERRAKERAMKIRALRIELAKDLAEIDEGAAFVYSGCASIGEYGLRIGLVRWALASSSPGKISFSGSH